MTNKSGETKGGGGGERRNKKSTVVYRKTVQCDTFLNALKEISLIVDDENENENGIDGKLKCYNACQMYVCVGRSVRNLYILEKVH